jgi:outer membrane protein, multidrug efflux system
MINGLKFKLSRLVLIWIAAGLSGCTMIPKYQRPTAPVAAQYPGMAATNDANSSQISWRNLIGDERLQALVSLALTNNRDMHVAVLNVEQSQAQYRVTRSALFPTIDGDGSYTRSQSSLSGFPEGSVSGSGGTFTSSGSATYISTEWSASAGTTEYEVDLWGRLRSLDRQALEKYFSTAEAQRSEQITLVAQVATEYFTWREADEELQLSRRTLQTVQESYDLNKAMVNAGASSELDLREAEGQVQTAKIAVTSYERQKAEAENYLTLLVGQPLPADLPAARPFADTNLLATVPAGLPSELIERRPDILEQEHTLEAANANIGAARAAFFPRITLSSSIGTTSSQFSQLFAAGTGVWSFSPQITLPIFTGGQNMADLDSAKVSKRIEIANYEKAIQTAFREVSDALTDTDSYTKQVDEEAALAKAQQQRYDLADARYRHGDDTYLNSLTAQQDLFSAQQDLIQTQFNKLSSQIALYKALGGGWK